MTIFDEAGAPVGSFVLDPGESVDVEVIVDATGQPQVHIEVLSGVVDVTVFGQTLTLAPGDGETTFLPVVDADSDDDGVGNGVDPDDDNDGVLDASDAFPLDASRSVATIAFSEASGSPVGAGSERSDITAADLNGDGAPDLITANGRSNSVSILLGTGSGGFSEAIGSPMATGREPRSVVVADLNGDGNPDLATANYGEGYAGTVTILLGNGSGAFSEADGAPVYAGPSPYGITAADLNNDGKPDLAVTNYYANNLKILLGDGAGGFTAAAGVPVGASSGSYDVVAADFNGDGKMDLAVANIESGYITILLGNGLGGFSLAGYLTVGNNRAGTTVAADFDADGRMDLATANFVGDTVTVFLGNGAGEFSQPAGSPFAAGDAPSGLTVADFNSDGIWDLAATNYYGNNVSVLVGNGAGGFTTVSPALPAGLGPNAIVAADVNLDGRADLATANLGAGTVSVLLNTFSPDTDGDGVSDDTDAFPSDPAESADSDGDGVGDNADTDDDNDGIPDTIDPFPLDDTPACGTTLTTSRTLRSDLSCGENGLTLGANNITLDCQGHTITAGGVGISFSAASGATVTNCVVIAGATGLYLDPASSDNTFTSNTITTNNTFAVQLWGSSGNTFDANTVRADGATAFKLDNNAGNTFTHNTLTAADRGFWLDSSSNNAFDTNTIDSLGYAWTVGHSTGNVINANTMTGDINIDSSDHHLVTNNIVTGRIKLQFGAHDNDIYNNSFSAVDVEPFAMNSWNTTLHAATNIAGGSLIGGNLYVTSSGGFSRTCGDDNADGICDTSFNLGGVGNNVDAFPLVSDTDRDGQPDSLDPDDDGDGVGDGLDVFPFNSAESVDSDFDNIGNNADPDDDNDGTPDVSDAFPLNPAEHHDADSDGIGDNADHDDNGDGINDDAACGVTIYGDATLTSDLMCDGDGLRIGGTSVTLECQGYTIDAQGAGVTLLAAAGATVNNCVVIAASTGIVVDALSSGNAFNSNTVTAIGFGVQLDGSSANTFAGNSITSSGASAVKMDGNADNVFTNNALDAADRGFWLDSSSNSRFEANTITAQSYGWTVGASTGNVIVGNTIRATYGDGINIDSSDHHRVSNNIVSSVFSAALTVQNGSANNDMSNNSFAGAEAVRVADATSGPNVWNTALRAEANIAGGPISGGNVYLNVAGDAGFSRTCGDLNTDGICDSAYDIAGDGANVDAFPLVPDTDADGEIDSIDLDNDNDGTLDQDDAFPWDAFENHDADHDGVGDNADPDDDNDGIADSPECGRTLAASTSLTSDLVCSGDGLRMFGDSITLNCGGHSITAGGNGITLLSGNGATIRNCVVTAGSVGIYSDSTSSGGTFTGNTIAAPGYGVQLAGSSGNTFTGNVLTGDGSGFKLDGNSNNTFTNNTITVAGRGFHLDSSSNNTFDANTITADGYGWTVGASTGNRIIGNRITAIDGDGLNIDSADHHVITGNIVKSVSGVGIRLQNGSVDNDISNNLFRGVSPAAADAGPNSWNTTLHGGINIAGGTSIGGNAYVSGAGGFSRGCGDAGADGICDASYTIESGNVDAFPLVMGPDSDEDGVVDSGDVFPGDETEWLDTDHDGTGDNADADDDDDGIADVIDRNKTTAADESTTYSSEYHDEADTFGTVTRNGWTVSMTKAGVGVEASVFGSGTLPAAISACSGSEKEVDFDASGEKAQWACDADGTVSVTAVDAFPTVEVRKQICDGNCGFETVAELPAGQGYSTGSPAAADPHNTQPIVVKILKDGMVIGQFSLDGAEVVDVEVTQSTSGQPQVSLSVLEGAVEVTVQGETHVVTPDDGEVVVNAALPTVTVVANAEVRYSPGSQSVSLSALVSGGAVSEGAVVFWITNAGGTSTLCTSAPVPVVAGVATGSCVIPAGTAAGSYVIRAAYSGTEHFLASVGSATLRVVANPPVAYDKAVEVVVRSVHDDDDSDDRRDHEKHRRRSGDDRDSENRRQGDDDDDRDREWEHDADGGQAVRVTLSATDADSARLTFSIVTPPAHGLLSRIRRLSCTSDGQGGSSCTARVIYTPTPHYIGPDSFTYKATDGVLDSNVATVTINLVPSFTSFTQGQWGSRPRAGNPGAFLAAHFAGVYGTGGVTIGAGARTLHFDGAANVEDFLPAGGKPGVLTTAANNPTNSRAGTFAGQVLALQLNVDFSSGGKTRAGLAALKLAKGPLKNQTVGQVLALANNVLGGAAVPPLGVSLADVNEIVAKINGNYDGGKADDGYLVP